MHVEKSQMFSLTKRFMWCNVKLKLHVSVDSVTEDILIFCVKEINKVASVMNYK